MAPHITLAEDSMIYITHGRGYESRKLRIVPRAANHITRGEPKTVVYAVDLFDGLIWAELNTFLTFDEALSYCRGDEWRLLGDPIIARRAALHAQRLATTEKG